MIILGNIVIQERQAKERKFVWVGATMFSYSSLCMRNKVESKK
jgi:hypothetical protein